MTPERLAMPLTSEEAMSIVADLEHIHEVLSYQEVDAINIVLALAEAWLDGHKDD